jgi:hypothetical protein
LSAYVRVYGMHREHLLLLQRITVAAYAEEGVLQRILTVAAYAEERRPLEVHGLSLKRSPSPLVSSRMLPYAHAC